MDRFMIVAQRDGHDPELVAVYDSRAGAKVACEKGNARTPFTGVTFTITTVNDDETVMGYLSRLAADGCFDRYDGDGEAMLESAEFIGKDGAPLAWNRDARDWVARGFATRYTLDGYEKVINGDDHLPKGAYWVNAPEAPACDTDQLDELRRAGLSNGRP